MENIFGCDFWPGFLSPEGYGVIRLRFKQPVGRKTVVKSFFVHRFVWMQAFGDIPDGMVVHQVCGNHSCVALAHLVLARRGDVVKRIPACKHGHLFTPDNVYTAPGSTQRYCRECARINARKYRLKRGRGPRLTVDVKSMTLAEKIAYFEANNFD